MFCRALLIPENYRMSRSVFCDASRVLIQISLTSVESSSRGILSISKSVGNSRLNLLAALTDLSNAGCVLSTPKNIFIVFTPPSLSLKDFGAENSLVCFIKGTQVSPL